MNREIGRRRALANAVLALAILGVAGFGMTQVASRQWQIQKTFSLLVDFPTIGGLGVGHRVRIQGIDAGVVETALAPEKPGEPVRLVLRVDERLRPLVRSDAVARIVTEGVVGAKVIEIAPGRPDAPPLGASGRITAAPPVELNDLVQETRSALRRIDAVAAAAEQGLGELNLIAASIRKGEGSLGKLVQQDDAYNNLLALAARGERTLDDVEENLAAMKRTWPLSRYFNDRSYFDRDRVLFHPGAERDSRVIHEADLFEPGRSVLTASGRQQLDTVAEWFNTVRRPSSEVVIAAFTDREHDHDLARILTQEQANAVRTYLVSKHSIQSNGWFSSRKIAAVGFGGETPRGMLNRLDDQPSRRIEIILFTPQT